MAKRGRRRGGRGALDTPSYAARLEDSFFSVTPPAFLPRRSTDMGLLTQEPLFFVEDRRAWFPGTLPTQYMPARTLSGAPARLGVPSPKRTSVRSTWRPLDPSPVISFREAPRVVTCIRRRIRKEVIHALSIAGTRVRKPKRSTFSSISCKE